MKGGREVVREREERRGGRSEGEKRGRIRVLRGQCTSSGHGSPGKVKGSRYILHSYNTQLMNSTLWMVLYITAVQYTMDGISQQYSTYGWYITAVQYTVDGISHSTVHCGWYITQYTVDGISQQYSTLWMVYHSSTVHCGWYITQYTVDGISQQYSTLWMVYHSSTVHYGWYITAVQHTMEASFVTLLTH